MNNRYVGLLHYSVVCGYVSSLHSSKVPSRYRLDTVNEGWNDVQSVQCRRCRVVLRNRVFWPNSCISKDAYYASIGLSQKHLRQAAASYGSSHWSESEAIFRNLRCRQPVSVQASTHAYTIEVIGMMVNSRTELT
jgi:hypothetical protein